jgi:peptidoglycan/LPS O-acetylase OafA/YrhL
VLSGFLIGGILIKLFENKKATYKLLINFWIKRWLRTLPNYYFVLFLLSVALPFIFRHESTTQDLNIKYVFFLQNLNNPHPIFFGEAWSLCVEEWFYILVPLSVFFLIKIVDVDLKKGIIVTAILVILLSIFFRYLKFTNIHINQFQDLDLNIRKQVLTRLDAIMFGIIGSYISIYHRQNWIKYKLQLFLLGVFFLVTQRWLETYIGYGIYNCVFSFNLVSISILFLLPTLSEYKKGTGFLYKFFTFISIISYSMYLVNNTLYNTYGYKILEIFPLNSYVLILLKYLWYWLFVIISSYLLYIFIERPFMDLRKKISD